MKTFAVKNLSGSLLVALCVICSTLSVWAADVASVTVGGTTTNYTSFTDAWSAANSATVASTIKLLQNVTVSTTLTYNNSNAQNCTLDLNGHTLSGSGSITSLFQVNSAGYTFTVTDGSANKGGIISFSTTSSSNSFCVNVTNGNFVLDAGKLYATSNNGTISCVIVEGGAFTMEENGALHAKYTGSNRKNSRAVHANGTNGTTTINGGTIRVESTKDGIGIAYNAGTVTVNGGRFNVTATGTAAATNNKSTSATIYIRGGYYNTSDDYLTTHVQTPCYVLSNSDATYKFKVVEQYTVTFQNYNGTSLQSGLWEKGATPAYNGTTPTKPADAQYTYTFDGWNTPIVPVMANVTYTAQYSSTVNKYTITFKNGEEVLQSSEVEYGATPAYTGATPIKPATAQYAYTFNGWDTELVSVTGDATYNATYSTTPTVASVTSNSETDYYATFDAAWSAAVSAASAATLTLLQNVTGLSASMEYAAPHNLTLDLNGHTLSGSGSITSLFQVGCAGRTFTVTDGSANKEGAISFSATSSNNSYCVNVTNGTFVLDAGKLEANSSNGTIGCVQVTGGAFTMEESGALYANYTGSGSGKNSRAVHANGTNGTTTINGGTIRVESNVVAMGIAYNSGTVTVNGGWFNVTATGQKAVTNKTSATDNLNIRGGYYNLGSKDSGKSTYFDLHVKAPYYIVSNSDATYQYRVAERYTVTFNNYDGTSLQSDLWEKGATPAYNGTAPTKPADAQYTYAFNGWDAELVPVTADATYTAQFSSTVNNYTVTVAKNEDGYGSISSTEVANVPYGSAVTVNGNAFTVNGTTVTATPATSDAQYTYTFSGWTNAPETVTGDVAVTANFARTENTYTVIWKDADGTILETDADVPYGTTPTFDGAEPTKAADEEYVYSFNGWSPAVGEITGNTEYTATYSTSPVVAAVTIGSAEPTYYATITEAWTAVHNAGIVSTLKLLQDVSDVSMLTYSHLRNCTLDLNGHTLTSNADQAALRVNSSNANATFTVTDSSNSKNGKIYIDASSTTAAYGVLVSAGNFVLNAGTIEAHLKANTSHGVRVATGASFTMSGGTIDVVTTNSKNGDGVFANGTATISGGTVRVNAAGTGNAVETSGTVTITDGCFNAIGSSASCVKRNNNSSLTLQGGVYNLSTNLDGSCATNYYVFTNSDATYQYKVAEGYTINFNNYDGTSLQSGVWEKGTTPAYSGETPTKPADAQYTYTFNGWSTAITEVTANTTYTATYTATLIQVAASVTVGNGEPANYATWDAAWTAATGAASASTITLLQDVTGLSSSMTYSASHNLTLDLNGHTLSGSGSITSLFQVNCSEYTFTVTDGTVSKNGKISYTASSAFYCVIVSGGTFILEAGKLDAISSSSSTENIGCVQVNGGAFTMGENAALHANYKGSVSRKNSRAVYANGGTTTINGGTIRVESTVVGIGIAYTKGIVTVNGGWFNITATDTKIVTNKTSATDNLNIRGGYYNISGSGTYLDLHVKAPYHVFPNSDATYQYKVAEGYTVTFKNYNNSSLQSGAWEKGATPEYTGATPTKPADEYYTYTFTGWDPEIVAVTANATYTAQFSTSTRTYTVIWKDADGNTLETDVNVPYGATPQYNGSTPTKAATDQCSYVFAGWSPELVSVTVDVTYVASFRSMTTVAAEQTKTITSNLYISTTTVEAGGKLNVEDNRTLYTENLILKATPSSSGEISGNVVASQNACFDFSQPGGFKARTWYSIAVPWQVDVPAYNKANCGVYTKCGTGSFVQQEMGRTFDLIYYDGVRRATGVEKAWNYIEDDAADKHFMYPGRAYMIYLASDADVIRFKKSAGADLHTYEVAVVKHPTELDGTLADWNGISNPATYKAKLDVGTTANKGQVYIPETQQYELFDLDNQLQVGQTVFVQPLAAKTVTAQREIQGGNMTGNPDDPFAAPHRRMTGGLTPPARFEVVLAQEDNSTADRIIVCMDKDKEADGYVVGHDLSKLGVSSVVPQMWVNRYNAQLCINTVAGADNTADYPLGIFVPDAGEYTIAVDQSTNEQSSDTEDSSLYLTYDGKAIWNLSYSDYIARLNQGDNSHYGLRIIRKAPQTPTGIDEMTIQNGGQVRKVLVGDNIYIIREGNVYSMDGKIVK